MSGPRLFTSPREIENIKKHIKEYQWYTESYLAIRGFVDKILEKGFSIPDESGYVFFDTCPRDNTKLIFDPYSESCRCPECHVDYTDEPYRRARILRYHAWLSQISIYIGIVYLMEGGERYAGAVRKILCGYAEKYRQYPNDDNELGPTGVFQSTYMESIWLMYLAGAFDMVRGSGVFSNEDEERIRNELFMASVGVILDYDELWNNRQAFNNAGICAVGYLYNDEKLIDHALFGEHGFVNHMNMSVLEDGLWYEGDNYHFATLPSMVNIAEMAFRNGENLYDREFNGHTVNMMFMAPLKSLQPDMTFPSRKDSGYASCIARKWYAGLYETAYTRYKDTAYADILRIAYDFGEENAGEGGNAAGIMDVFDTAVSRRNNLDWRGFLNATPELSGNGELPFPGSINMTGTGLAVLRKNDTYLSLDYGDYGGGHGHPDRLNLNYFHKGKRWLSDWGTCNYYFDQLRWYRSTIGHNTVVVDGRTQMKVSGTCTGFEEKNGIGFVSGAVAGIAPGVEMRRTEILFDEGLLLDICSVESTYSHKYHYVLHGLGRLEFRNCELHADILEGENYRFLSDVRKAVGENSVCRFTDGSDILTINSLHDENTQVYSCRAFGPPDRLPEKFPVYIAETDSASAAFITLFEAADGSETNRVTGLHESKGAVVIDLIDGKSIRVIRKPGGFEIEKFEEGTLADSTAFSIDEGKNGNEEKISLTGATDIRPAGNNARARAYTVTADTDVNDAKWKPNILINEKRQMRRGDGKWNGKNDISGEAMIFNRDGYLTIRVKVTDDVVLFKGGKFPYDNDSIQVYIDRRPVDAREPGRMPDDIYGYILIPGINGNASSLEAVSCFSASVEKTVACVNQNDSGYEALIDIPWENIGGIPEAGDSMGFDIILNDRDSGERRDMQMVWSGCCDNERIYLKQDHHEPQRFGRLEI